ncbi:MAG: hypothetical protein ACK5FV_14535, partial [Bacteroidota bacterium]
MKHIFIGILLLLRWTDSWSQTSLTWSYFTSKRTEYPVLSPLADRRMRTHYVGLQVDNRLLY